MLSRTVNLSHTAYARPCRRPRERTVRLWSRFEKRSSSRMMGFSVVPPAGGGGFAVLFVFRAQSCSLRSAPTTTLGGDGRGSGGGRGEILGVAGSFKKKKK